MTDMSMLPPINPPVSMPPRRERGKRDRKRRVVVTRANLEIVLFLYRYRVATTRQLLLRFGLSLDWLNKVLRRLYDADFVNRLSFTLPGGSAVTQQMIYAVSGSSVAVETLTAVLGQDPAEIRRQCRPPAHLLHALLCTHAGLMIELASEHLGKAGIRLSQPLVERQAVDRFLIRRAGQATEQACVIRPDLFVTAMINGDDRVTRIHLAFECDRGHVSHKYWVNQATNYLLWERSQALAQVHGVGTLRVLVVTTGENRVAHLSALCREAGVGNLYSFVTRQAFERASGDPEWFRLPLWRPAASAVIPQEEHLRDIPPYPLLSLLKEATVNAG